MRVNIVAVGRIKEDYLKAGIKEYEKRISRFCKLAIFEKEESKNTNRSEKMIDAAKMQEGQDLLSQAAGYLVALDSKGEMLTSEELAALVKKNKDSGKVLTFVIGGSDGLGQNVIERADKVVSFGKVTYPHQLIRLMLTEQVYRAFSILANAKYHK